MLVVRIQLPAKIILPSQGGFGFYLSMENDDAEDRFGMVNPLVWGLDIADGPVLR